MKKGDQVRVVDGPFAGFEAVIVEIDGTKVSIELTIGDKVGKVFVPLEALAPASQGYRD